MIRLKDVAREAGVSPQTVSNFFNRPDLIKDETKQKVGEAVRKLGYTPNASARRLRTKRSNTLAIGISPNSQSPVFDKLLHSLATEAGLLSMRILLYKADSQQDELEHYKALCAGEDVDAFILTNTVHNDPRPGWLTKHNQEFVLFGRPWGNRNLYDPHIAWVDVDGRKGIREITQRLILTGHRQIGFLGWPSKSGTGDDRFAGWKDAVTQAKLMPTKELDAFSRRTANDIRSGEEAARKLLASKPSIDALVCASDTLATGAYIASGGKLPVTGFDNSLAAQSLRFPSIDQNTSAVAHELLRIINAKLAAKESSKDEAAIEPCHVLLDPLLMIPEDLPKAGKR
ncbi:LacI family DNA-binding transcriptional regulator [Parascardovia denticolens]|uniref:LacI family DNA-binding transcriptional regulator n=1 Tax=Parascardovia denticolens TaxID=78258 RepID=UPI00248E8124|nr:LacI family DNA-binding transcriptional regulator [Parascardovia denticolens]